MGCCCLFTCRPRSSLCCALCRCKTAPSSLCELLHLPTTLSSTQSLHTSHHTSSQVRVSLSLTILYETLKAKHTGTLDKCWLLCVVSCHQAPPADLALTQVLRAVPRSRLRPPPPPPGPPTSSPTPLPPFPALQGPELFYCQPISQLHKGGLCNGSFQMLSVWKNIPKTFRSEGVCPLNALGRGKNPGQGFRGGNPSS